MQKNVENFTFGTIVELTQNDPSVTFTCKIFLKHKIKQGFGVMNQFTSQKDKN